MTRYLNEIKTEKMTNLQAKKSYKNTKKFKCLTL